MSGILLSLKNLKTKAAHDTRMRFSVEPFACDSGFTQWHDAMKMCVRLPGGIPQEFRRRMWLTLAEQHVRQQQINWKEVERNCFNEWSTPDDVGLGDQIVKDLHRTGCTLFCGVNAEDNQALLKRVLLGYARWNKGVGYCQGFNMLAAIILEVMDRQESDALKVMIYLIEGVLPESYFANNLRGLSVDMAVFRDLMRAHLPELSRHLEYLQKEASDQATGACYEPPLTNVFTMQWFLTLFSNCLPKDAVMRVWDLTFLQGNEMLLRTALAIWGKISDRILEVQTADEFYTVMGVLTQEMLAQGLMDTNQLVQTLVGMAPFPFPGLVNLRDKYTYNITPWGHSVSSVAKKGLKIFYLDDEDDDRGENDERHQEIAVAAAFGLSNLFKKGTPSNQQLHGRYSPVQGGPLRPNLDISSLKKQYEKLRERQKQAHIILTVSHQHSSKLLDSKRSNNSGKSAPLAMKHLLRGKKALTSKTKRVVPQGMIPTLISKKKAERKLSDSTGVKQKSHKSITLKLGVPKDDKSTANSQPKNIKNVPSLSPILLPPENVSTNNQTLYWKDAPSMSRRSSLPYGVKLMENSNSCALPDSILPDIKDDESEKSSTSTELCDDEECKNLSDEEINPEVIRPMSSSPRLETFNGENSSEKALHSLDRNDISLPIDLKHCCDHTYNPSNDDSFPKNNIDIISENAPLPKTLRNNLSSPTKWKWSFSEVEDPYAAEVVTPIITLHNFASQEEDLDVDISSLIEDCPKITLNNQNPNYIDSSFIQHDKNNMFSYLFQITDITKLSNNNSENPSPADDDKVKYFDTEKLEKSLNSNNELIENSETKRNVSNDHISNVTQNKSKISKQNNIIDIDYHSNSSSLENVNNISHELYSKPINVLPIITNKSCYDTKILPDIKVEPVNSKESFDNSYGLIKSACNGKYAPKSCDIEVSNAKVLVNNIKNSLDLTSVCNNDDETVTTSKSNENFKTKQMKCLATDDDSLTCHIFEKSSSDKEFVVANSSKDFNSISEIKCTSPETEELAAISKIDDTVNNLLKLKTNTGDSWLSKESDTINKICIEESEIRDNSVENPNMFDLSNSNKNRVNIVAPTCDEKSYTLSPTEENTVAETICSDSKSATNNDNITGVADEVNVAGEIRKHSSYFYKIFNDNQSCADIISVPVLSPSLRNIEQDGEPNEDLSSELIRRRLWAGVKCLSLDAATIYENMKENALETQFPSLPTLDESPGENLRNSSVHLNKIPARRNSEFALQLMSENTKMIDKFSRHASEIEEDSLNMKEDYIEVDNNSEDSFKFSIKQNDQLPLAEIVASNCELHQINETASQNQSILLESENCGDHLNKYNDPSITKAIPVPNESRKINNKIHAESNIQRDKCLNKCHTNAVPFSKKSLLRPKPSTDNLNFKAIDSKLYDSNLDELSADYKKSSLGDGSTKFNKPKHISSPFPLKPIHRSPNEVGVKLGLYSPKK